MIPRIVWIPTICSLAYLGLLLFADWLGQRSIRILYRRYLDEGHASLTEYLALHDYDRDRE